MLIPHNFAFRGLDPRTTPQIDWGNLNPQTDYANDPLLSMAIRSVYISCAYDVVNCKNVVSNVRMFIKVAQSGGRCDTGGSCTDWQEIATGGFMCGTCPPIGTQEEFCCASLNTWYLQNCEDKTGVGEVLWLKVGNDCSDDDWMRVAPTEVPVLVGTVPPKERINPCDSDALDSALCCAPVGSKYVWTDSVSGCTIVYTKLFDNCAAEDWVSEAETCVIVEQSPLDPVTLCDLPVGSFHIDNTDPADVNVYIKISHNCDASGWMSICCGDGGETQVVSGTAPPDADALCDLPIGSIHIEQPQTDGGVNECPKIIRIKVASNCDADDWCETDRLEPAARRLSFGLTQVIPTDVETQITGLTTVDLDNAGMTGIADVIEIPCDGYYNIVTSAGGNAIPVDTRFTVGVTIDGNCAGRSPAFGLGTGYDIAPIFTLPGQLLTAGQQVGVCVLTTDPAGITITNAYVSVQRVEDA